MEYKERFESVHYKFLQIAETYDDSRLQDIILDPPFVSVGSFSEKNPGLDVEFLMIIKKSNIYHPMSYWQLRTNELLFLKDIEKLGEHYNRISSDGFFCFLFDRAADRFAISWFLYAPSFLISSSLPSIAYRAPNTDPSFLKLLRLEIQNFTDR